MTLQNTWKIATTVLMSGLAIIVALMAIMALIFVFTMAKEWVKDKMEEKKGKRHENHI